MALRQVRVSPDEILTKKSRPVAEVDDKIRVLVDDMKETMYSSGGVGLAAVQVGVLRRVLVIDVSEEGNSPVVAINPEVLHTEGTVVEQEACLSVPNLSGLVERDAKITVRALNEHGKEYELECDGFLSIAMQHEIDHLNGILYDSKAKEMYVETDETVKKRRADRKAKRKK
ncbi:MAG: peptide deformylase [Defluviitaleaceae bacterium]|nr:peptide deformylase [Defluviitaleaceae bacterium]